MLECECVQMYSYSHELSDIRNSFHLSCICANVKIDVKLYFLAFLSIWLGELDQMGNHKYPIITL